MSRSAAAFFILSAILTVAGLVVLVFEIRTHPAPPAGRIDSKFNLWRGQLVSVNLERPPYVITSSTLETRRGRYVGTHEVDQITAEGLELIGINPRSSVFIPWHSIASVVDASPIQLSDGKKSAP